MNGKDYQEIINKFGNAKILVVGDVMLDAYVYGLAERLSVEAPVPIVLEQSRRYFLGGAGNVAANIASLGGKVTLVGITGNDEEAETIKKICKKLGIDCRLFSQPGKPTILKTRFLATHHQLLRVDRESDIPLSQKVFSQVQVFLKNGKNYDAVVLSDYSKGCISKEIVGTLRNRFGQQKLIAGIKPQNSLAYKKVGVITLNQSEGKALTGISADTDERATKAAKKLSDMFSSSVLLTRGPNGITMYDKKSGTIFHSPAHALQVFDVTGAGDTVLAAFSLAYSLGAGMQNSADIANHAAGIVVQREGTATVKPNELVSELKRTKGL